MRRPEVIARQSSRPTGVLGRIIATIMSYETSALNRATLDALQLCPTDRVLEIGYGHGRTLATAAQAVPRGQAVGIDASATMQHMAERRCRKLMGSGRVQLDVGDSAALPYPSGSFDAVYAVHTIYFWSDVAAQLREIHRVLKGGGRLVLGFRSSVDARAARNFPESIYTFRSLEQVRALLAQARFEIADDTPRTDDSALVTVKARSRP